LPFASLRACVLALAKIVFNGAPNKFFKRNRFVARFRPPLPLIKEATSSVGQRSRIFSPPTRAVSVLGLHPDFVGIPLPALRACFPLFGKNGKKNKNPFPPRFFWANFGRRQNLPIDTNCSKFYLQNYVAFSIILRV